ncbi:unnamed protein product [Chondrus crispus]|uniref:Uncharacterized protein n=1 Tax=Chondrus crispus TaxID=2769 RepID=R7Q4H0_CHOCR|nr:unnamed protein product [Chondrus crispus]CDF33417.1 unnamed protein product [Chondrus crispus]|eukprot:XP_005713220.1 unnamed protein product [Chondrus crispus]
MVHLRQSYGSWQHGLRGMQTGRRRRMKLEGVACLGSENAVSRDQESRIPLSVIPMQTAIFADSYYDLLVQ